MMDNELLEKVKQAIASGAFDYKPRVKLYWRTEYPALYELYKTDQDAELVYIPYELIIEREYQFVTPKPTALVLDDDGMLSPSVIAEYNHHTVKMEYYKGDFDKRYIFGYCKELNTVFMVKN